MRLTHLGHSCLLVEVAGVRILIDPGAWSPGAARQRDLDAVLVTHQHQDHLDREKLSEILATNPEAELLTDPDTARILRADGVDAEAFSGQDEVRIGAAVVTAVGELHALIHPDLPRVTNTGMRVAADGEPTLFHPGDALDGEPGEVDVLAFPLQAPWAASRDMTAFLRRLAAPVAVPIHDGLLNEPGRQLYLGQAARLGSPDTTIRDLSGGEPADFGR